MMITEYNKRLPLFPDSSFNIHLQWFAAEDEGRTEDPTEQKIKKAREEGKVAKSAEITSAIVLLFPIITFALLSPYILKTMIEMLTYFLTISVQVDITSEGSVLITSLLYILKMAGPILVVALVAALMGNILQVGFLFSVKPITPDLNKIIPKFGKFLKKSFASSEAFFNLAKALIKVAIIGVIAYLNINSQIDKIISFTSLPFLESFRQLAGIAFLILVESAVLMLAFSLPDYFFQKKQHTESLKMSKQEVKEERKMSEGDPLIRRRLKEKMRELLSQNQLQNVPNADVIVTNPTHFAVGLEYGREKMNAPTVIAKGQDNMAFKIREIAKENDVPIIENKPLARALYADVEIGEEIPEQYYDVMAIIMAEVYRLNEDKAKAV